jgi:acyl carrier protein
MKFEDLKPIICRVFTEEEKLEIYMKKSDILSWDSLGHLNLILEIEDSLEISFSKEEIESIDSLQGLLDIINTKNNGANV